LVYFAGQTDKMVLNRNYEGIVTDGLVLNLDAGFTPSYPKSGTTWYDIKGTNNGTLTNGPTFDSENGGSIEFDGTNDYVRIYNKSELNPTNEITVICWFKLLSIETAVYPSLIVKDSGSSFGANQYGLWIWRGGLINGRGVGFRINISSTSVTVSSGLNASDILNEWTMAVGTYNGTKVNLYVYNKKTMTNKGSSTIIGTIGTISEDIFIGRNGINNNSYSNALISQINIYNRALSATEVLQNYNAQKGRFGL
jgi:hypothetical protein